ncbi:hypothetical protein [Arthrobacter sp. MYb214]|uniref:hypothetical protein n=1 Tax=Arthrobacter sp. MYb214 TaxID=1848596 RepID=UPI0011B0DBBA|nr:hypothetical protein [Arthrobacter sp. MYb214]
MTVLINPKTKLKEEFNEFFRVPLVHQRGTNSLNFTGQRTALHTVPLGNGLSLDFYAQLGSNDELVVTFMGANLPNNNFYPKFSRISSMRGRASALIAFADPTMKMDVDQKMLLSWYLGGAGFDPALPILKAIKKAQGKTGSKHVIFIGGSGGGYAALRISAMMPGSMAFVQEPQTNIANYIESVVNTYFQIAWPGWNRHSLLQAFPERFDMVRHYHQRNPENFVYYAQSVEDTSHVTNHYMPFKDATGLRSDDGVSPRGNMMFSLYRGQVSGHGKITPAEYDEHLSKALEFWRSKRGF